MRLIYADYNPYTNSIDVNTFENYILRIAAFCGLSFLLAIKITSKLSNFILHQFGGLHKLWDAPRALLLADFLRGKCHLVLFHWRNNTKIALYPLGVVIGVNLYLKLTQF